MKIQKVTREQAIMLSEPFNMEVPIRTCTLAYKDGTPASKGEIFRLRGTSYVLQKDSMSLSEAKDVLETHKRWREAGAFLPFAVRLPTDDYFDVLRQAQQKMDQERALSIITTAFKVEPT